MGKMAGKEYAKRCFLESGPDLAFGQTPTHYSLPWKRLQRRLEFTNYLPRLFSSLKSNIELLDIKGQLQRFDKLSLFDRFRHVENGFDNNFGKLIFVFLL